MKEDDINLLVPSFRPLVQRVLEGVRAAGYKPLLKDTLRTDAEAARNAARGTGSKGSMHCYGVAADVICAEHHWDCHKHGCDFFEVLGTEVEKVPGLVWGGRWTRGGKGPDKPHFQCVRPGTEQNEVRRRKTPERVEDYVATMLATRK